MRSEDETIQPIAAILNLLIPGLGYLWFRETARAVYAFIGIGGLLLGGLLIGGIDVVDSRDSRYWFYVQLLNPAAVLGVDYAHQNLFKGYEVRANNEISESFFRKPQRAEALQLMVAFYSPPSPDRPNKKGRWYVDPNASLDGQYQEITRIVRAIISDPTVGTPSPRESIGRVNEIGSLFIALAGMLNLIVLLDVGWHAPRPPAGKRGGK